MKPETLILAGGAFSAAFAADPAYAEYARARQAGSVSNLHVIDDTDVAGTIPYLARS